MVSTDVIVEASAILIAGIGFLVTIRQAQKLPIGRRFLGFVMLTLFLLILSAAAAVAEDLVPASWGWQKVWTWVLFLAGLVGLAILVYMLTKKD
jgi:hypothetical protein